MSDFNWKIPKGTNYTGRDIEEICETAREEFFKKNGYYPTPEEAVILTDEARKELECEKRKNGVME